MKPTDETRGNRVTTATGDSVSALQVEDYSDFENHKRRPATDEELREMEASNPASGSPSSAQSSDEGRTVRSVTIPAIPEHAGFSGHKITVRLYWICPAHGTPRGDIFDTVSYDGSRRLGVNGWQNPCGCVDGYNAMRKEAKQNGLND